MFSAQFRTFAMIFALFTAVWPGTGPAAGQENNASGKAAADSVLWPLTMPTRYLTSNFMEYRPGRFHAGIDLKTDSRVGFAVHAAEDGHLVRARITPTAYGRAIYLKGNSGRTYVYAHLMRFNDRIRTLVRDKQEENGGYRASLFFAPGQVPVKKGEVLALTGQAGTGGPHLHLEVRDQQSRPLNPLDQGFPVADDLAPVISAVSVWPVEPATLINGEAREHRLRADQGLTGELPPLNVRGPVAFSARIVDATDVAGHRLEPWLIQVHLDGELVYSCRNERFSFAEVSQQRLEWADHTALGRGFREHWLHRAPQVDISGRQGGLWYLGAEGGGLTLGRHTVEVVAWDRSGNQAAVTIPLLVDGGRAPAPGEPESPWRPVDLSLTAEGGFRLSPFFITGPVPDGAEVLRFSPAADDPVLAPLHLVRQPFSVEAATARNQGLEPLGPAARFSTSHWPLDSALRVGLPGEALPYEADDPQVGVYRLDQRGGWQLVGVVENADDSRIFSLSEPGPHALMRDKAPPVWDLPRQLIIGPGGESDHPGLTMPFWRVFGVGLDDDGSGLAAETIRVQLDGVPLLVEPDLPRDRILVELPDTVAEGAHLLLLEAADKAGNRSTGELRFHCRKDNP